jgi:FlaA1/EpsC-like NDP-sugar epimerase
MTAKSQTMVMTLDLITGFPSRFRAKDWKWIRFAILLSLDLLIIFISYYVSFLLRFDTLELGPQVAVFERTFWIFLMSHALVFTWTGMYRQVWRYANLGNAILIVVSTFLASLTGFTAIYLLNLQTGLPRSVPIILWSLSTIAIGALKFSWRGINGLKTRIGKTEVNRCFIYGAGSSGELLARFIKENAKFPYKILGFIDDDPKKVGRNIHGRKILGTGKSLEWLAKEHSVSSILIAMNSAPGKVIRDIVANCHKIGLKPMIMPEISQSIDTDTIKPRQVDVRDILRRSPKSIDHHSVKAFFTNKTVLVTGAGGTIGSEISRQILENSPKKLLLLDSCELNLYTLENELSALMKGPLEIAYLMGSVTDKTFIERVFAEHRIDCVLHAAAYKHVHLVEANPVSGVINNILGTKILVDAVLNSSVSHFLLISSDKAVNPTGVMGKTKRVCELYLQAMNDLRGDECRFCSVRFGNVLGSSGSVIPRFIEQIEAGGPVTVTHPNITRYFMLVSEAVSLVLQSLILTKGGETFVLKMGDPVNIFEMAKQLIALAGKKYGEDIDIVLTGLRPGEKLYEEILYEGSEEKSEHEDILIVYPTRIHLEVMLTQITDLLALAKTGDEPSVRKVLDQIVQDNADRKKIGNLAHRMEKVEALWLQHS